MASDSAVGQDDTVVPDAELVSVPHIEHEPVFTETPTEELTVASAPERALDVDLIRLLDSAPNRSVLIVNSQEDFEVVTWALEKDNPKRLGVTLKTTSRCRCRLASR